MNRSTIGISFKKAAMKEKAAQIKSQRAARDAIGKANEKAEKAFMNSLKKTDPAPEASRVKLSKEELREVSGKAKEQPQKKVETPQVSKVKEKEIEGPSRD